MPNVYTDFHTQLQQHLNTELVSLNYPLLEVRRGVWNPATLTPFERYLVFLSPPTSNPWDERRISTKEIAYTLRSDIFLLVKNYNEERSVYGDTAPELGVFQLISDVKAILRRTDLGGLLDRTFNETASGSAFETGAAGGFDSGTHGWVHRAKLMYTAQMRPFCHP